MGEIAVAQCEGIRGSGLPCSVWPEHRMGVVKAMSDFGGRANLGNKRPFKTKNSESSRDP